MMNSTNIEEHRVPPEIPGKLAGAAISHPHWRDIAPRAAERLVRKSRGQCFRNIGAAVPVLSVVTLARASAARSD